MSKYGSDKNVSQNRIFSPLRVGSKTIENEPPLGLKLMNFTSLNCTHIHNYYLSTFVINCFFFCYALF